LWNSVDRCGQPIKDSGCFEVALVVRILFRLLAPPFCLFFEIAPKFHMPNHVYSLLIWLSEASMPFRSSSGPRQTPEGLLPS
jgi:hypothetical protein